MAEGGDTLIHGTAAFNGGWWIRLFELSLLTLAFSILLWAGGSSAVSKWPQLSTRETVRAVSTGFLMVAGAGWGIWSLFRQLTSGEADLDELVVTLRDHLARS